MAKNDYWLRGGESLLPGEQICRGSVCLRLDARTGQLTVYAHGKPVWGSGVKGTRFLMQPDGNAVLFDGGKPVWTTRTAGNPGAQLNLDNVGVRFIVYKPAGGKWQPIWDSKSHDRREGLAGGAPKPGIVPDPMKILKSIGAAAGNLAHGKISASVKSLGRGVNQITGSQIIQAAFPVVAPANIVNGAVTGGKSGAVKAAQSFLKNPVAKATYTAVGVVFPPIAPVTAGAVAGMEASSRLLDGLESKDPKMVASAALQLAATQVLSKDGIPGATRALDYIDKTGKARGIAGNILSGDPEAQKSMAELKKLADSGDPKAQAAHHLLSAVVLRESAKTPAKPAVHAAGREASPTLLAQVHSAMTSPHGLRIGDFSVLKTGRVLHKGKAIPHSSKHKTSKRVPPKPAIHPAAKAAHLPR